MANFEVPLRSPSSNCLSGVLLKWTNYLYGWQERYFVLKQDGTLLYYRSQDEIAFGCRGGIKLELACVSLHEFDECRFDIAVGDCVWYLRAFDVKATDQWVEAFVNPEKAFSSGINQEINSTSDYVEKLSDIETSRDILYGQIQNLRHYFDISINSASLMIQKLKKLDSPTNFSINSADSGFFEKRTISPNNEHENLLGEIKREILTFKATTADLINSLSNCVDMLNQRENQWNDKLENEQVERKAIEKQFKRAFVEFEANRRMVAKLEIDDLEEEKSVIEHQIEQNEDFQNDIEKENLHKGDLEFYDAIDADYHFGSKEEEKLEKSETFSTYNHELWPEIERVTTEQFYNSKKLEDSGLWELILQDGEMRIYRKDVVINGIVCDPYKLIYTITGITAHELCLQYYSLDNRFAIDPNVESCKVLEELDSNTSIVHMVFKRFWPTAQRDFVFWSHIRQFDTVDSSSKSSKSPTPENIWTVVNKSCSRQDIESGSHCVRVEGSSVFTCETFIDPPVKNVSELTREHLKCKITYSSQMNPGGWVPASFVRAGVKREFPKFVKTLTQFSIDHYRNKPIMM